MRKDKTLIVLIVSMILTSCGTDKPLIVQNSPVPTELAVHADYDATENESEKTDYTPLNYEIQKAVWISYIELADKLSDSETDFRENIDEMFYNISQLGCNTVYVHVRAFGDAYYRSDLYSAAKNVPTDGDEILYDPLEIMTAEAHQYGLSFHAWINPFRCDTESGMERMSGTQIYEWYENSGEYAEYVVQPEGDSYYWLNPSIDEVRELIADGVREIALNYEVDGVHIDDYFYPTTDESFDSVTFAAAESEVSLAEWRLENCSQAVSEIYAAVKSVDENLLFGVSPQGNVANNYSQLYADVERWCAEDGYLDYIVPQIYFGYDNEVCPFAETLSQWKEIAGDKTAVCGIGFYKLDDEFADDVNIISRQIEDALDSGMGFSLYSYSSLFENDGSRFAEEREAVKELIVKY